jgi:hypothetical protein
MAAFVIYVKRRIKNKFLQFAAAVTVVDIVEVDVVETKED